MHGPRPAQLDTSGSAPTPPSLPEYTLAGILHFLQSQWRQYERDRNDWEIERAALRARNGELEGERLAAENVKTDLMRRVKMLEYVLRRERAMYLASRSVNGSYSDPLSTLYTTSPSQQFMEHMRLYAASDKATQELEQRKKSRMYLTQCLEEINHLTHGNLKLSVLETRPSGGTSFTDQHSQPTLHKHGMTLPHPDYQSGTWSEEEVDDGASLASWTSDSPSISSSTSSAPSEKSVLLKPGLKPKEDKHSTFRGLGTFKSKSNIAHVQLDKGKKKDDESSMGEDLSTLTLVTKSESLDQEQQVHQWKLFKELRHHLDSVRSISFDDTLSTLVSGSDDCTVKLWNVDSSNSLSSKPLDPKDIKTNINQTGLCPVMTFRGHQEAVTSVLVSSMQKRVFSGSIDGTIRVWMYPSNSNFMYSPYDPETCQTVLVGHTDAIWELCFLPSPNLHSTSTSGELSQPMALRLMNLVEHGYLASVSSDGTVKIWNLLCTQPTLLVSWDYYGLLSDAKDQPLNDLPIPTAVTSYPPNWRLCVVGYTNGVIKLFEIESGKQVNKFLLPNQNNSKQINKIVAHPTSPLVIAADEAGWFSFINIESGEIQQIQAHNAPIIAMNLDPSGLTLVSGGQDCSVRFWDLSEFTKINPKLHCVQEITAHYPKASEGILDVKFHPSASMFASAGADAVIRIYH